MEQIQNKPTSTKKRSLESHEESGSKKGMKKQKLEKTEPKMEAESKETDSRRLWSLRNKDKN